MCLGEKRICLAISEPYAGSDVSKIHTTATMHPDGNWRVNGGEYPCSPACCVASEHVKNEGCLLSVKKWITGGMVSDYFTALVQTKEHGFCMMLIEVCLFLRGRG